MVQRNVLIIQWKEYLGDQQVPCGNPRDEQFKWVRSREAAMKVLSKRVKSNIQFALWNGIFLIEPPAPVEVVVKATEDKPEIVVIPKKQKLFDRITGTVGKMFGGIKKFTRQKH